MKSPWDLLPLKVSFQLLRSETLKSDQFDGVISKVKFNKKCPGPHIFIGGLTTKYLMTRKKSYQWPFILARRAGSDAIENVLIY